MRERAAFCDVLWQQDGLVMLRRETPTATTTVIDQMTLDEIAEGLEEIREANFDALSISDNALFSMYIHAVRAKDPKHDHAHCDACDYYNFTGPASQEEQVNAHE